MRPGTLLVRVRFMNDLIEGLDLLAAFLSLQLKRKVRRAALVRAIIAAYLRKTDEDHQGIIAELGVDPVKMGRTKKGQRV